MKQIFKILGLLPAAMMIAFATSCSNDDDIELTKPATRQIQFSISADEINVNSDDAQTRATVASDGITFNFETGDIIQIKNVTISDLPGGSGSVSGFLTLASGAGTSGSATFSGWLTVPSTYTGTTNAEHIENIWKKFATNQIDLLPAGYKTSTVFTKDGDDFVTDWASYSLGATIQDAVRNARFRNTVGSGKQYFQCYNGFLRCNISGLTASTDYTVSLLNSSAVALGVPTLDITSDGSGNATFFVTIKEMSGANFYIQIGSQKLHLSGKNISIKKIYTLNRNISAFTD